MISVAMTTYNGAQYITEQLDSIRMQTRKVDEVVIVDDGSHDNTVELVRAFEKQHPECGIRLEVNEVNLGFKKNFYKAMSLCGGDVIFLCDQDDIWKENKVAVLTELLESNSNIGLISSSFIQIDSDGKEVSSNKSAYMRKMEEGNLYSVPLRDLIFHNVSQGCAMVFRKEVRDVYLKFFTDELPHDWALNVVAAMEKKCYYLNSPMFYYRIHGKNTIGLNEGLTLKKKNSVEVRTYDAKQAMKVLCLIEHINNSFCLENPWLEQMRRFSENHIRYLEKRNFIRILLQNFNPYYKRLKTVRGRLLDMFFCVKK